MGDEEKRKQQEQEAAKVKKPKKKATKKEASLCAGCKKPVEDCKCCCDCGKTPCECCPECGETPGNCKCCEECEHSPCICDNCPECGNDPCTCNNCEDCGCDPCKCGVTEKTAAKQWGLDLGLNLTREAANFYVLMSLTIDYPNDARPKYALIKKTEELAVQFSLYMDMAIGGELRHAPGELGENGLVGFKIPKTSHRGAAWLKWKDIRKEKGIEALQGAYEIFSQGGWGDSYGGESWAKVVKALIQYETGKWSAEVFVDQVFSIRHNGGPVFDKIWNLGYLEFVLDDAQNSRIYNLCLRAEPRVQDLQTDLLAGYGGILK